MVCKSKSKDGKPGWVQADGSPCANEKGETKTPKCFSSQRLASLKAQGAKGKAKIAAAVRRKREQILVNNKSLREPNPPWSKHLLRKMTIRSILQEIDLNQQTMIIFHPSQENS